MFFLIAVLILVLWFGGHTFAIGGDLINLLLLLAVIFVLYELWVRYAAGRGNRLP